MKRQTILRTGVVLLAAVLVIAVTWARYSPYDWKGELAAQEGAAKGQMPAPGAEAMLRHLIAHPLPGLSRRSWTDQARMGPLQSIGYLGSIPNPMWLMGRAGRTDNFRVTYQKGVLLWRLALDKKGKPAQVFYFDPSPSTPAQTIQVFTAERPWWFPMIVQLVALFVFATVGRYVLRIRL